MYVISIACLTYGLSHWPIQSPHLSCRAMRSSHPISPRQVQRAGPLRRCPRWQRPPQEPQTG